MSSSSFPLFPASVSFFSSHTCTVNSPPGIPLIDSRHGTWSLDKRRYQRNLPRRLAAPPACVLEASRTLWAMLHAAMASHDEDGCDGCTGRWSDDGLSDRAGGRNSTERDGVVRHAHVLSTVRWDPSGHVFVYGAQLVPLWRLLPAAPTPGAQWPVLEALLGAWTAVLWYLSFTTASFFHTLSETAAGYALVLLLALALRPESSARTGPAPCTLAALLWLSFTAVGFASRVGGSVRASLLELGYDAALWATLAAISTRLPRRGDVAGGQTELTE